jgi:dihydroxyacid dehydratase/phosphogluconate dehydratase
VRLHGLGISIDRILTQRALENAMLVHAAFGGSTNFAAAHPGDRAAGGSDAADGGRLEPDQPVDAAASSTRCPNGPRGHPTVQVFMAGGVPEVMLHLRDMGLLNGDVLTATGETLDRTLDWWRDSDRRRDARARLASGASVMPDDVIKDPDSARRAGFTSTVVFPLGNLAPEGSVLKATAIDASVVDDDQVYRHTGPARVFADEREAIAAVKGGTARPITPGDVIVLIGNGPSGTGMQETAQITTALKYLPWGKQVALLTDGRFSGFSSGACIGHIGPEALQGGPISRVQDDDVIEIVVDRGDAPARIDQHDRRSGRAAVARGVCRAARVAPRYTPALRSHEKLPNDTRLWAALQRASGGTWGGCVYDVDRIIALLDAGMRATVGASDDAAMQGHTRLTGAAS